MTLIKYLVSERNSVSKKNIATDGDSSKHLCFLPSDCDRDVALADTEFCKAKLVKLKLLRNFSDGPYESRTRL